MGIYSRSYALSTAAAETSGCVGRAGDVCRASARTNLIDEISVLSLLAQLEVSGHKLSILVCEFVAEFLHCVRVDECAGCFTFCVNSTGYVAEALAHIEANRVNVAVGCAAAVFDISLSAVEAVFEAIVDSIEAITESVGNTTELSVYVLIVEALKQVGTSECTLDSGVVASTKAITKESAAS